MITTKEIKIKKTENLTSEYIEKELIKQNLDVLRWSIIEITDECYVLNIAMIEKES